MPNYKVIAKPWEHGYELHVTGPNDFTGCTQSLNLTDMLGMARQYIQLETGEPLERIGITLTFNMQAEPETSVEH